MPTNAREIIFDPSSHARFVEVSRDRNPVHVDAVAARRTQAGAPIIHGVHALLRLLERLAESESGLPTATSLKVLFRKPIYPGDRLGFDIVGRSNTSVRARLVIEGTEALLAAFGFGIPEVQELSALFGWTATPIGMPDVPNDGPLKDMLTRRGCLTVEPFIAASRAMFPIAASCFGAPRIAAFVCISGLVGMIVPGLHSLLAGLEVVFDNEKAAGESMLRFAVKSVDPRLRLVTIAIHGSGLHGLVDAVSPPPAVKQPGMGVLKRVMEAHKVMKSTSLIVGGSRGVGELTAKLIASGGGQVVITYATGQADAEGVAAEIRSVGGYCETLAYDIRRRAADQLALLGPRLVTHLYYFATPFIFRRKAGLFDLERFREFNSFYLEGLLDLVKGCLHRQPDEPLKVFVPSSVAVESRTAELTEYAMSKAAAEILCFDLERAFPNVHVLVRRLPRLLTDQTNSVVQVEIANPIDVLLPIVREMHGS